MVAIASSNALCIMILTIYESRVADSRQGKRPKRGQDGAMDRGAFLVSLLATAAGSVESVIGRYAARVSVFAQPVFAAHPALAIQADETFPSASIIKLAIMLAIYRDFARGTLAPGTQLPFTAYEIVGASQTFGNEWPGRTAPVSRLLKAMIQQSDNTAANVLLNYLGLETVNAVAAQYGLQHTRQQRYFMHFSTLHDNLTCARDVGRMLLTIARGARSPIASSARARYRSMLALLLGQEDKETIAAALPPGVALANKTGELPAVRHDAGIVDPYGRAPFVLVILTRNIRSQEAGVSEIRAIARAVYQLLRTTPAGS